jgi:hypothetical protein
MKLTLEIQKFFCTTNLDAPYVAALFEDGRLVEQFAYYSSAEAATDAGMAYVRDHYRDAQPDEVQIEVAPEP